jgi:hypothetical protein
MVLENDHFLESDVNDKMQEHELNLIQILNEDKLHLSEEHQKKDDLLLILQLNILLLMFLY